MSSNDKIAHYGVLGMKWGVRKDGKPQGYQGGKGGSKKTSRRTDKTAKKDAAEFTKAKMFYGQGAGNRRKLIKATVEQRKKNVPGYADAFEKHVSGTDMAKRSKQAVSARKRADVKLGAGKTFRGVTNMARGNPQAASAAIFAAFTIGGILYKAGAFDYVVKHGPDLYSTMKDTTMKMAEPMVDKYKDVKYTKAANEAVKEALRKTRGL